MDSYASQPSSTDASSLVDESAQKWKDLAGSTVSSPREESDDGTERKGSDPMEKLRLDTDVKRGGGDGGEEGEGGNGREEEDGGEGGMICESPTEADDTL